MRPTYVYLFPVHGRKDLLGVCSYSVCLMLDALNPQVLQGFGLPWLHPSLIDDGILTRLIAFWISSVLDLLRQSSDDESAAAVLSIPKCCARTAA